MSSFKSTSTRASGIKYPLSYPQYDDLAEMVQTTSECDDATVAKLRKALEPFAVVIKPLEGVVNQQAKQGSTQANKGGVRDAAVKAAEALGLEPLPDGTDEKLVEARVKVLAKHPLVKKAIKDHQKDVKDWSLGEARGDGLTNAQVNALTKAARKKAGDEKFLEAMEKFGVTLEDLK